MPTVFDIPRHLLSPDQKEAFIGWIKNLPVDTWIKRDLVRIWKTTTNTPLEATDWLRMGL